MRIVVNGQPREVAEQATLAELLRELGLASKPVAVEVNGEVAPRAQHAARQLRPGDVLEIVTLVGGG